jgi:hypothetical protein
VSPPVDLHWFFEISISAFISNWDKNSVINWVQEVWKLEFHEPEFKKVT